MTTRQFLKHLAAVKDDYTWRLYEPLTGKYGWIRGAWNGATPNFEACPINAVCFKLTGERFSDSNFNKAGERLGMSVRQMCDIASAADSSYPYTLYVRYLRWRMKGILGL